MTNQILVGTTWFDTGTSYFRYYQAPALGSSSSSSSSSSHSSGFVDTSNFPRHQDTKAHLPKYVLYPGSFDRLKVDPNVTNPFTAPDSIVGLYADHYFEFDNVRRVTKEVINGGSQTFLYSYARSPFGFSYDTNIWIRKTTETLPDGSQNIVYTNSAGKTMMFVYKSGSDTWIDYYQYDVFNNLILHACPSAVTGYDESLPDLIGFGQSPYLRTHDGLIFLYTYDGVSNYVTSDSLKQGTLGTPIKRREYQYISCGDASGSSSSSSSSSGSSGGVGPVGPWFVSKETVYPSDTDQTIKLVTTFAYTFYPGTCGVQQVVTTLPAVATGQNGSGVSATRRQYYDQFSNLTWEMDERGFITRFAYDITQGAVIQRVDDVNTSLYADTPAGWTTMPGGGKNLVTDYVCRTKF